MRAILGLLSPSSGSVKVFGQIPERGNSPAIGYLPQVRTVLPDLRMRGRDFIGSSLYGEHWGVPSLSRQDRSMIEETLDTVSARDLAAEAFIRYVGRRAATATPGASINGWTEAAAAG